MIPVANRILKAMRDNPRGLFIGQKYEDMAGEDKPLPIDKEQTTSAPSIVFDVTREANLTKNKKVLEVGTGSGWQTVIMAQLAKHVFTIEIQPDILRKANDNFNEIGVKNITSRLGNGKYGWPDQAPFDVIVVSAAMKKIPRELGKQLTDDGVIIFPFVMEGEKQQMVKMWKDGSLKNMGPVKFVNFQKEY